MLIDGYYLDGYRGVPLYLNKIVSELTFRDRPILCIKKSLSLSEVVAKKYRVIRLPNMNYILWEQLMIPMIAIIMNVKKVWSPANTISIALLFFKKEIIITVHDLIFFEKYSVKTHFYQKVGVYYRRFVWSFYKKFKQVKIISVSQTTKKELQSRFGLNSTVIYHGVEIKTSVKTLIEDIEPLPEKFCLHLGSISPSKGSEIALKEFSKCQKLIQKGYKCIVLGKFYNCDFFLTYQNNDAFIFYEYISDSNLALLYKKCRLFLSTSIKEGFGFGPLEAIINGAPVIVMKSDIADEILGNIGMKTFHQSELSETIELLAEKNNHKDMREACINFYSWKKSIRHHQAILAG